MIPNDFSEALLKAGRTEGAPAAAKARAAARVLAASSAGASSAASLAGKSAGVATTAKLSTVVFAAMLAGGVGAGSGFLLGQKTAPTKYVTVDSTAPSAPVAAQIEHASHPQNPAATAIVSSAAPVATGEPSAARDVCEDTTAAESKTCSTSGGHTVTFALKSACSKDVLDVFWVDESCREVFKGMLHPGEMFWQDSWDTHVFRVRDHATHRLVKELTPTAVAGAPDRAAYWKGAPTELPTVTVKQSDAPVPETTPPECAHGGGRAAKLHVKNERTDGAITLMSVDGACVEHELKAIAPGEKLDRPTSEGHAFRVRDVSGALLLDIPPTSLDTTTYLSVP